MNLTTQRLLLRNFKPSDAAAYCAMTADAEYQRFYSEEDCSHEKSQQLVTLFCQQSLPPRTQFQLAIEEKVTGAFLGTVGLRLQADRQASIGFGLVRDRQLSGFGYEAMSALLQVGFHELGVHRVYAETLADNEAAIRLCQKLGMREEGRFVEHRYFKERWWTTVVMAMRQSQWASMNKVENR